MERVQEAENHAVANDGADVHHDVAVLGAWPLAWRLGYLFVAGTVMALCAGLLDGPWAAGFAYAVLLLGVASICRAVIPPRLLERGLAEQGRAVANDGHDNRREVAVLHARRLVWRPRLGYVALVPVMAICAGLLGGTWADCFAYAALLLGVASIWHAMFPPPLLELVQAVEGRAVVNDVRGDHREVATPEAAMAWCGYVLVAAPVMGSCFGLADTPAAALVAYALVLLGFAFISLAMLPLRPMERFMEEENRAARDGNVVVPRARGMDWTGYFFVAAPVLASCVGLVDGLAASLFAYALLLLGNAFIIIAMLALAKPNMV